MNKINKAVTNLKNGQVIVIETDTLYGLATMSANEAKIYELKNRDLEKPLINMIYKIEQIADFDIELTSFEKEYCKKVWPGATTLIFKNKSGTFHSFRIPDCEPLIELLKTIDQPLKTTSANLSGAENITDISDIKKIFPNLFIYDGGCKMSFSASQIYLIENDKIIKKR